MGHGGVVDGSDVGRGDTLGEGVDHVLSEILALAVGGMPEKPFSGNISESIDSGGGGTKEVIRLDKPSGVSLHARRLEVEDVSGGTDTGGAEESLGSNGALLAGSGIDVVDGEHLVLVLDAGEGKADLAVHVVSVDLGELLTDVLILGPDEGGADELGDLDTYGLEVVSELTGDVSATDGDDGLGLLLEAEDIVRRVVGRALEAGKVGDLGDSAHSDHDSLALDDFVTNLEKVVANKAGLEMVSINLRVGLHVTLSTVGGGVDGRGHVVDEPLEVNVNHLVNGDAGLEVELLSLLHVADVVRSVDVHLGRDAAE